MKTYTCSRIYFSLFIFFGDFREVANLAKIKPTRKYPDIRYMICIELRACRNTICVYEKPISPIATQSKSDKDFGPLTWRAIGNLLIVVNPCTKFEIFQRSMCARFGILTYRLTLANNYVLFLRGTLIVYKSIRSSAFVTGDTWPSNTLGNEFVEKNMDSLTKSIYVYIYYKKDIFSYCKVVLSDITN